MLQSGFPEPVGAAVGRAMLYNHHRALGLLRFFVCRSQYSVMREPSVNATSNQCRRRYSSPRSREELFQVEQTAATSYRRPRQWNAQGSPGSPRLMAAESKLPGTGSTASLTNSPCAGVTSLIRPSHPTEMQQIPEPPAIRRPKKEGQKLFSCCKTASEAISPGGARKPSPALFFSLYFLAFSVLLAGCNTTALMVTQPDASARAAIAARTSAAPPAPVTSPIRHFEHVVIIVLENQDYATVIKDPYFARLAKEGASFTHFYALFHPSQPNYLAMVGGRLFEEIDTRHADANVDLPDDGRHTSLADRLEAKGLTWKNYAENYPAAPGQSAFLGASHGRYARKHVPFLSFRKVQQTRADHIIAVDPADPNNRFVADARSGNLPNYAFYSPNLDDDGHDPVWPPSTGLAKASKWLQDFLTHRFPPALRKDTLVVVTYDESYAREPTNRIYTVLLGDSVKPAAEQNPADLDVPYTHYDVLRTIEENFGLNPLAESDRTARPITGIWR
jgi:hypothetical protein